MAHKFVAHCLKHGAAGTTKFRWEGRQVAVAVPSSKKQRRGGGCPECLSELRAAQKSQ